MENKDSFLLKNNDSRVKNIYISFGLHSILLIIGIIFSFAELDLLERLLNVEFYTEAEIDEVDFRVGLVGILQFITYLGTIIAFLLWFYRSYSNVKQLKSTNTNYDKNMTVWGFIIPIYNLFVPYKIMNEINDSYVQVMEENELKTRERGKWLIICWWVLYIISATMGQIVLRTWFKSDSLEELIFINIWQRNMDLLSIIEIVFLMFLVFRIAERERIVYQEINKRNHLLFDEEE